MTARRSYSSYNDGCASAHALDLIGERWTLIVVRELLLGPKRFAELQRDVAGIGPAVLSTRLRELEARGIATRRTLPAPARVDVYELTEWGRRLEAVNAALSAWAVGSPDLPWEADMSPDTLVLAMRAHARPEGRADHDAEKEGVRVSLHLRDSRREGAEEVTYSALVSAEQTVVEKVPEPPGPAAEVHATTAEWKAWILGGRPVTELAGLRITGSEQAVARLIAATRFERP
ncbi:MAG: helix-turn-helix transcriptional regulator [Brachybacterium sp.]|nr:helix-turn-helix transcriptional regulator [Brachybacterium sp.]